MRLIDADVLIEDFKKELEKVDFEKISDNDGLIISTSAYALIDFAKRQPTVENGYNQALEDFEKCLIQQSIYTETEEGWSGMTVDTKTIKNIKEQLKKDNA